MPTSGPFSDTSTDVETRRRAALPPGGGIKGVMNAASALATIGVALALSGCCALGGKADSGNQAHELAECGIVLELPNHFGKPVHGSGCAYEWSANEGTTTLAVTGALPGDNGQETEAKTAMPGQTVDYARDASFGTLAGRERRTQEKLGPQNRCVWTGFVRAPKGNVNVKLVMVQKYTADEFGEPFWRNVRTSWLRPLAAK
jgi:hypothetical protein